VSPNLHHENIMNHDNLSIETFVEPSFGENAYLLSTGTDGSGSDSASSQRVGWIIDPSFPPAVDELLESVRRQRVRVEKIILTHGHADHIAGLDRVKTSHPGAAVWMACAEAPLLQDAWLNLSAPFGLPLILKTRPDADLEPGIKLRLGGFEWIVSDVSGHSPGGRALYCALAGVALVGDALFQGSIGRTDFPGSDHAGLLRRIRENLLSLPPETVVYSGHGPATTVGNERKFNPFLTEASQ
jgi:glyoxylase-like metal-dependent hydrolase (beta-lactamase superfamily II)